MKFDLNRFGRGLYGHTYKIFKGGDVHWHLLRIIAFDVPDPKIHFQKYEDRYKKLCSNLHAPRMMCKNSSHVNSMTQEIIDNGGEGIILQKVNSLYISGRSSDLVKLKAAFGDQEGIVTSIEESGVRLKLPDGKELEVPKESISISETIKPGDIVSFSFESRARMELPVNPKIDRIRHDLSWNDVLQNFLKSTKNLPDLPEFNTKPMGYRTLMNMRNFLEEYAKKNNLDPLAPDTWYNVPYSDVLQFKPLLLKYKGYFNTLEHVFPDIKFDHHSFPKALRLNVESRREFFLQYAKDNNFDPFHARNWYIQPLEKILATKGSKRVIHYYQNNVGKALMDLFPDIGLDKYKLWGKWHHTVNRRKFFEDFAETNKFDYQNPENWYSSVRYKILQTEGVDKVLSYYNGRLNKALLSLFPDIGLDPTKLRYTSIWNKEENRKAFFEEYARDHNFDPLLPSNWYSQSIHSIKSTPGFYGVIGHHNCSASNALMDLFPNIGLRKHHFASKWV